jgi:hypothetical protein
VEIRRQVGHEVIGVVLRVREGQQRLVQLEVVVGGRRETTDNGGRSWKKTVVGAVASPGGLAGDSVPKLAVKEELVEAD